MAWSAGLGFGLSVAQQRIVMKQSADAALPAHPRANPSVHAHETMRVSFLRCSVEDEPAALKQGLCSSMRFSRRSCQH